MDYSNPHDLLGSVRNLWWNELTVDKPIALELVDYFSAPTLERGRGVYTIYYCLAQCDYPDLGIVTGDCLNFHLSWQCYLNALKKLRHDLVLPCTREHGLGKNLFIKLFITSKTRLTVLHQELREPTEDQLAESKKQYAFILEEHKELIKGGNKR